MNSELCYKEISSTLRQIVNMTPKDSLHRIKTKALTDYVKHLVRALTDNAYNS